MKRTALLLLLITASILSHAQVKWNPTWQPGSTQTLEYTYDAKMTGDTFAMSDTAHAFIQAKYLGISQNAYWFEWRFDQFYGTTVNETGEHDKRVIYPIVNKTLARCPVIFNIDRSNFQLAITNEAELDSVTNVVMDEMLISMPDILSKEDKNDWNQSHYPYLMYRNAYKPIRDYFWVYSVVEQPPNVKKEIQPYIIRSLSSNAPFSDTTTGYYILEDSDPRVYKWKLDGKIDLSVMMNAYNDLSEKWEALGRGDTAVKKKVSPGTSMETIKAEIELTKSNMEVISFHVLNNMEMHIRGTFTLATNHTEIKVIK